MQVGFIKFSYYVLLVGLSFVSQSYLSAHEYSNHFATIVKQCETLRVDDPMLRQND